MSSYITKLTDTINYQSESIVSKTLIDKENGTVTLFAFDKGQGLSEHAAPFDAMVHIIEGKAQISISGNIHHLSEGDIIIMPAHEPHAVDAVAQFKMVLIMIRS